MDEDDFFLANRGKLNSGTAVLSRSGQRHDLARAILRMQHSHALLKDIRRDAR